MLVPEGENEERKVVSGNTERPAVKRKKKIPSSSAKRLKLTGEWGKFFYELVLRNNLRHIFVNKNFLTDKDFSFGSN